MKYISDLAWAMTSSKGKVLIVLPFGMTSQILIKELLRNGEEKYSVYFELTLVFN